MATGIHCKHWDYHAISFKEKKCKAGINPVLSYCDNNLFGWIKRTPCLKTNEGALHCPQAIFPTREEVDAQNAALEARMDDFLKWMPTARGKILEVARETNSSAGTIECPKCGKTMRWSRARSNGHVHAHCEAEECLSWME